jgi:uncharacterized membrane protein
MARRAIVAVFNDQNQAYDSARRLQRLDERDDISLKRAAIVTKDNKGNLMIPDTRDFGGPWGLLGGGVLGAVMGAMLGPAGAVTAATGAAAGAVAGGAAGGTVDLADLGVREAFVEDVSAALNPGQSALIAEIDEGSTDSVDRAVMESSGRIYREDVA